jgi:hypothetical protein
MKPYSTTAADRIQSFIHKARLGSANPNSSTEVLHVIMGPSFQKSITTDREVARRIMARGWSEEIRAYLKGTPNGDAAEEGMSKAQADFWPNTVRKIVIDIGRARVYVPSRMEYVPLMPETISSKEIKEAGEYLIKKGEECLRIGNRLIELHEAWGGRRR